MPKSNTNIQHVCYYCGDYAQYQLKNKRWCCRPKSNKCPAIKQKNSKGVKNAYQNGHLLQHKKLALTDQIRYKIGSACRGKTKDNCEWIKLRGQKLHQKYLNKEIKPSWEGRKHTTKEIQKIVHGMIHNRTGTFNIGFKRGWYKGYWCDSSWELAFIIYNLQHDIKFERNIKGFQYIFNQKKHLFYPDFFMENNQYIQIKGYYSKLTDAKINQFPKHLQIKVLYKQDLQKQFNYVINKYGNNYWNLLKKTKLESIN